MSRSTDSNKEAEIREGIDPSLLPGLTFGKPEENAKSFKNPQLSHMAGESNLSGTRQPRPHFVAEDSDEAVWMDGVHDDRLWRDVRKTYTAAGISLLRQGRQCLRCDEPQPDPFPIVCDLCGYPMRDRQIMDIAMEFEGEKHLGPAKPLSEYKEDLELRAEKRRYAEKLQAGKSPMKGTHGKRTTGDD